jgi:hypothetical protein
LKSPGIIDEIREKRLTLLRQGDKVQLFAFLWPGDVWWQVRVHEGLKVRAPPLRQGITNFPVLVDSLARELRSNGGQALIQALLEALNLLFVVGEIITGPVR